MLRHYRIYSKGFTLIELLVVIAIIGLISSVVLASINSARAKAQIASTNSNLKSLVSQAEILYDAPLNFSTVCADSRVANILSTISNTGWFTTCLSYNNAGLSDVYLRWGASALRNAATPLIASSVSQNGVGVWDTKGVNSSGVFIATDTTMTWTTAMAACALSGARLPTLEELKTLSDSIWSLSLNTTHIVPGFAAGDYWSGTSVPSTTSTVYIVSMTTGGISTNLKTVFNSVRCIR